MDTGLIVGADDLATEGAEGRSEMVEPMIDSDIGAGSGTRRPAFSFSRTFSHKELLLLEDAQFWEFTSTSSRIFRKTKPQYFFRCQLKN